MAFILKGPFGGHLCCLPFSLAYIKNCQLITGRGWKFTKEHFTQYHSNESHKRNFILEYCKTFFDKEGRTDAEFTLFQRRQSFFFKVKRLAYIAGKQGLNTRYIGRENLDFVNFNRAQTSNKYPLE